ncbi:MAG: MFS transporter [Ideonella sp.]|nr:MFS transporter [Ideonella sp.]
MPAQARGALVAFGGVSFSYFAYTGLFATYAPLWLQHLGFSTLAIGSLASMQAATRIVSPYAWGWLADHSGSRTLLLRWAVALALVCSLGYFGPPSWPWIVAVTVALFLCTAGVIPINEAALAHLVSRDDTGALDAGRYGRVRVWGSVGFILAVSGSGFVLQWAGLVRFPWLVVALLALLLGAALLVPMVREAAQTHERAAPALAVLRQPAVAWFFAGVFFTVLAHVSLYAFFSLYLAELGYGPGTVGLMWALSVAAEVLWFWFQGRRVHRVSMHGWLVLAALVSMLRFAAMAAFGNLAWVPVIAQCTHAVTFAAKPTACIGLINRHFPGRLRGRGQALYTVLGYGASGVVGGVAGGALSEALGFAAVFWAAAGAAAVSALCCWRALACDGRG